MFRTMPPLRDIRALFSATLPIALATAACGQGGEEDGNEPSGGSGGMIPGADGGAPGIGGNQSGETGAGGGTGVGGAGGSPTGGTTGSGGDTGSSTELDEKCTPTFTLDMDDAGPNGSIFTTAVGNDPEGYVQEIGRQVCRILYRSPEEVRDVNHITLIIEDSDGVAWKAGDIGDITVGISANHLKNVQEGGRDVGEEISGILFHEMTHMYQHDDKPEATFDKIANMYEGIADAVRIRAGYTPSGAQPTDKSGNWADKTYTSQAFFWLFVDNQFEDFLHDLNLSMVKDGVPWQPSQIEEITAKTADALWSEYQASTCCDGGTTSCCQ